MKIGDKIRVKMFDGYGRYGNCYWKIRERYVKEIGEDYIVVNCKSDLSGKRDLKIRFDDDKYKILK